MKFDDFEERKIYIYKENNNLRIFFVINKREDSIDMLIYSQQYIATISFNKNISREVVSSTNYVFYNTEEVKQPRLYKKKIIKNIFKESTEIEYYDSKNLKG